MKITHLSAAVAKLITGYPGSALFYRFEKEAKKDSVSAIFKGYDVRLFVAKSDNWNGSALINSYNVGDTLR